MLAALASGDPAAVAAALGNDLQAAAISLQPELRRTLRAGCPPGALAGVVSGSGPTVALLCADAESAGGVAAELAGSGTCRTVRVAVGPAPGARLVGTDPGVRRALMANLVNIEAVERHATACGPCSTVSRSACRPATGSACSG